MSQALRRVARSARIMLPRGWAGAALLASLVLRGSGFQLAARRWWHRPTSVLFDDSGGAPAGSSSNPRSYVNVFEELTEAERQEVMDLAFGDDHVRELPRKVAKALEEDYDVVQGVNPNSRRPLPLKANIDFWVHRAKNETDFGKRAALYQRCISYNPTDGRAWLGLARIYAKKGQLDRAEKSFKDGLYYSPKNPFLLQAWAVQLEKQGKLTDATKLLTRSIKSNPAHAASWVALAKIHQRTGRLDEARYCFSSACDADSRSYVALQAWGALESSAGNVALARDLFARATKASGSRSAHTLQAWATLEKRQGNLDEALRLLEAAQRTNRGNSRVCTSLAELCELRGDMAGARRAFELGERGAQATGDAGLFQSWALFELRRESGVGLNLDNRGGWGWGGGSQGGGNTAGEGDDFAAAEAEAEAAIEAAAVAKRLNDGNASVLLPSTKVRLLFKRAVTVNRFHSASWVAWAKYEQRCGNIDVARRLLVTGISNFPHSRNIAWFHCSLGRLSVQDGDMHTARACYERALTSSPPQRSLNVWLEFAHMEDQFGSLPAARRLYEGAVKRFPVEDRAWEAFIDFERRNCGNARAPPPAGAAASPPVPLDGALVSALLQRRAVEQAAALVAQQSRSDKTDAAFRSMSLTDLELPEAADSAAMGSDGSASADGPGADLETFWDSQTWVGLDALFAKPASASRGS